MNMQVSLEEFEIVDTELFSVYGLDSFDYEFNKYNEFMSSFPTVFSCSIENTSRACSLIVPRPKETIEFIINNFILTSNSQPLDIQAIDCSFLNSYINTSVHSFYELSTCDQKTINHIFDHKRQKILDAINTCRLELASPINNCGIISYNGILPYKLNLLSENNKTVFLTKMQFNELYNIVKNLTS